MSRIIMHNAGGPGRLISQSEWRTVRTVVLVACMGLLGACVSTPTARTYSEAEVQAAKAEAAQTAATAQRELDTFMHEQPVGVTTTRAKLRELYREAEAMGYNRCWSHVPPMQQYLLEAPGPVPYSARDFDEYAEDSDGGAQ